MPLSAYDGEETRWDTIRLCRPISGTPEEDTFILVHAEIESHTPSLLQAFGHILRAMEEEHWIGASRHFALGPLHEGLLRLHGTVSKIIASQLKMFNACDPSLYVSKVRPWIFGAKGNPDFPAHGVTFEGVKESTPASSLWDSGVSNTQSSVSSCLRGETGAQSSIVPCLDAVLGITHEAGPLRVFLAELEYYRPPAHKALLSALRLRMWGNQWGTESDERVALGVAKRGPAAPLPSLPHPGTPHQTGWGGGCMGSTFSSGGGCPMTGERVDDGLGAPPMGGMPHKTRGSHSLKELLRGLADSPQARACVKMFNACVAQVWAFRDIHYCFAELYISRYTRLTHATGGTPFKAYLSKHLQESSLAWAQIVDGPGGEETTVTLSPPTPTGLEFEATLDKALTGEDGIPHYLRERHR